MELTSIAKRLLIATVLIPLVLTCVVYDQGMLLVTCLMSLVGMREFVLMRTQILFPTDPPKGASEHVLPPRLESTADQLQMYVRCALSVALCAAGYLSSPQLLPTAPVVVGRGIAPFVRSLHSSLLVLAVATAVFLVLWVLTMFDILHAGRRGGGSGGSASGSSNGSSGSGSSNNNTTSTNNNSITISSTTLRTEDFLAVVIDYCGVLYTGGALSFAMILTRVNKAYMALVLMCNWACDAMAMFCGKSFGRFKLNAKLSPNKTWEGALGAVVGGAGAALIARALFTLGQAYGLWDVGSIPGWGAFLQYGCVLGVLGIVGDLVKSYMKRIARIKDSGQFFGTHGGVLDRIDGLLFSFPVIYFLLIAQTAVMGSTDMH